MLLIFNKVSVVNTKGYALKHQLRAFKQVLDEHHEILSNLDGSPAENALTSAAYGPVNTWLESYIDKRRRRTYGKYRAG